MASRAREEADRVDVLYIAGARRSGSTLLDRLLSQTGGLVSLGELRFLWEESLSKDNPCGCGRPFSECPFWLAVMAELRKEGVRKDCIPEWKRRFDRMLHLPRVAWAARFQDSNWEEYSRSLRGLYDAIKQVSGAEMLIDSSKDPSYAHVLSSIPGIRLRIVHLVRDSRAVAYSWQRRKLKHRSSGEDVFMERLSASRAALGWAKANVGVETLRLQPWRVKTVRYEDLVDDPARVLSSLFEALDLDFPPPVIESGTAHLGRSHTLLGNPMRFQTGTVKLSKDVQWEAGMSRRDRLTVTGLTAPLLLRYGYSLIPSNQSSS